MNFSKLLTKVAGQALAGQVLHNLQGVAAEQFVQRFVFDNMGDESQAMLAKRLRLLADAVEKDNEREAVRVAGVIVSSVKLK